MKQTENLIQGIEKNWPRHHFLSLIVTVKNFFSQLDIPVGKFFPDKVIEKVTGNPEFKLIKVISYLGNGFIEVMQNPTIRYISGLTSGYLSNILK